MARVGSLVLGAFLAFCTVALASSEPGIVGTWKLSIGAASTCTLTLAADAEGNEAGIVSPSSDCASGLNAIGRWKATAAGLQLFSPSGDMIAWLKQKDGAFSGTRLSDGKTLALAR